MTSTADLRLRALEPEDLELIYRVENDTAFWRHGSTTVPYSRYALRQFLSESTGDLFRDGQVRLVIERRDGERWRAIGFADLVNFDAIHLRAEIGLLILPEFQGHHHGEAAVEALTAYAGRLHLHQLYAIIAVTNRPATRIFERLAFMSSTVLKDWVRGREGFTDARVWQKLLSAASATA
ncbi:MAG: GNAT family N-acetyltransferase [Bacteroidaceae bacterium]|nr:GNAT family N-acetyltransferase [Bacteroidaceae bacterium]